MPCYSAEVTEVRFKAEKVVYDESGTDKYFGFALPGTATSVAQWKIFKLEYTGTDWVIKYANGSPTYTNIWDNRLTLSYS